MGSTKYTKQQIGEFLAFMRLRSGVDDLSHLSAEVFEENRQAIRERFPALKLPTTTQLREWNYASTQGSVAMRTRSDKLSDIILGEGWRERLKRLGIVGLIVVSATTFVTLRRGYNIVTPEERTQVAQALPPSSAPGTYEDWASQLPGPLVRKFLEYGDRRLLSAELPRRMASVKERLTDLAESEVAGLNMDARVAYDIGEADLALDITETALELNPGSSNALTFRVFLLSRKHDPRALQLARECEPIARAMKEENPRWFVQAMTDLGNAFNSSGDIKKAKELWREAYEIKSGEVTWKQKANALTNSVSSADALHSIEWMRELSAPLDELMTFAQSAGNELLTMSVFKAKASMLLTLGPESASPEADYREAETLLKQAFAIADRRQLTPERLNCHVLLASTYEALGDKDNAVSQSELAYGIAKTLDDEARGRAGSNYAKALANAGKPEAAQAVLIEIWDTVPKMSVMMQASMNAMRGETALNDADREKYLEDAAKLFEKCNLPSYAADARAAIKNKK